MMLRFRMLFPALLLAFNPTAVHAQAVSPQGDTAAPAAPFPYRTWHDLLRNAPAAPQPRPEWRRTPPGTPPEKNLGTSRNLVTGETATHPVAARRSRLPASGSVAGFPGEMADAGDPNAYVEGAAHSAPGLAQAGGAILATPPGPSPYVRDYPWRTIYKLLMRFGSHWYACSASTFDGFHLMTAGHCVYNFDPNDDGNTADAAWADDVWVFPAQTDLVAPLGEADQPFGEAYATLLRSWSCWTVDANWDCDWGLVTLDRNMGDRVGWMGRAWGTEEANLNFSGYPVETPYVPAGTLVQYPGFDANNAHDYTPYVIPMYAYVYGGHSGGPVWRYLNGDRHVFGTNSRSDRVGNAWATRYTSDEENYFTSSSSEDATNLPPAFRPDLAEEVYYYETPLKDLQTPVVGRRAIISFTYNVANHGWLASGPVNVNFYASWDTYINGNDIFIGSTSLGSLDAYTYVHTGGPLRLPASVYPGQWYIGWTMQGANGEYLNMDYCGSADCNNYGVIADLLTVTSDSGFNWTVTASAGAGGSIAPAGAITVEDGTTASFTITPTAGYGIAGVSGSCGGTLAGNIYTTWAVHADCTVIASFNDVIFRHGFE